VNQNQEGDVALGVGETRQARSADSGTGGKRAQTLSLHRVRGLVGGQREPDRDRYTMLYGGANRAGRRAFRPASGNNERGWGGIHLGDKAATRR